MMDGGDLFGDGVDEFLVGVSEDAGGDTSYEVEVFFAIGVGEGAPFSFGNGERVATDERIGMEWLGVRKLVFFAIVGCKEFHAKFCIFEFVCRIHIIMKV